MAVPLFAGEETDNCARQGIIVKNLTMIDLWYRKNGGDCFIWTHDHVFVIMPGDIIEIFSDLTCKTTYCSIQREYHDYQGSDSNGDCAVKILPDCMLADM